MKKVLIQLDSDPHPSVFDAVVATDAGVDSLLSYGGVEKDQVRDLVYGAMFTRGPQDLNNTALFIGGGNVADGEALLEEIQKTFFGPMRVSVMLDSNGCNTTAVAAVLRAGKHIELGGTRALVLGATGPVGQRVSRLLAAEGTEVRVGSRSRDRAAAACDCIHSQISQAKLEPVAAGAPEEVAEALDGVELVISAGAAGALLLPEAQRKGCGSIKVAIDLNAVPPTGIEGVEVTAKAVDHEGVICYGAIGVGGTKMKIHKAAVESLFKSNDQVLDAEAIYALGQSLD